MEKPRKFKCEMCQKTFEIPDDWSDEDAKDEAGDHGLDTDTCGTVCDDCYKTTPWGSEA